jgi:predicted small lipoprotein YifL
MALEIGREGLVEMKTTIGLALILVTALAGCGQKGPLYLPGEAKDIVTRPAAPSPGAPNSPQTVDSPVTPPSPAPEVSAPERTPPDKEGEDKNGEPRR